MRVFLFCSEAIGGVTAAPPKAAATRDMRFDAIRGLLLISMAAVHVPTLVSHFLNEPLGFMSDAEGFIFLSACLAGLAYGKTYRQTDWSAMSRRVWHRAGQIYWTHLAVILPVVLAAWVFAGRIAPLANHFHDFLVHPWGSLALIPLLLHQPPLFEHFAALHHPVERDAVVACACPPTRLGNCAGGFGLRLGRRANQIGHALHQQPVGVAPLALGFVSFIGLAIGLGRRPGPWRIHVATTDFLRQMAVRLGGNFSPHRAGGFSGAARIFVVQSRLLPLD